MMNCQFARAPRFIIKYLENILQKVCAMYGHRTDCDGSGLVGPYLIEFDSHALLLQVDFTSLLKLELQIYRKWRGSAVQNSLSRDFVRSMSHVRVTL